MTTLPGVRPRGDELGLKTIARVGGSMRPGSSRSASSAPAIVSPMPTPVKPATETMSPPVASSKAVHPPVPFFF